MKNPDPCDVSSRRLGDGVSGVSFGIGSRGGVSVDGGTSESASSLSCSCASCAASRASLASTANTVGFTASTMSAKLAKLREAILCRPARADDVSDSGGLAAKVATAHTAPASARPHTAPLPSAPATLVEKIRFAIDPSAREDSGRSLLGVAATSAAASRGTPARFVRPPQRSLNQRAVAKAVPCVAAHEIVGAALHSRWVGGSEYLAATFRMEICGTDRLPGKLRRLR